jgi:hypothetical protein
VSVLDLAGQLVYYPYMASIVGKKRGNQTYYYLVESARVNGKPRIVAQEYSVSRGPVGPAPPCRRGRALARRALIWIHCGAR